MWKCIHTAAWCVVALNMCLMVRSDDRPPCNGQTANGFALCGAGRGCNPANNVNGNCAGNTVTQRSYAQECVAGTASEYCASQDGVICTETFNCTDGPALPNDPFHNSCVAGSPTIGSDGKPINSTADGKLVSVGCQEQ